MNKHPYIIKELDGDLVAIKNNDYWEQKQQEKYLLLLKQSGIPKNYWDIDFIDYKGDQSILSKYYAQQYALRCKEEKFHNISLYIWGGNSTQKSMVACAIGKEFIRQGFTVRHEYAGKIIEILLKNQGFSIHEEFHEKLKNFESADLLIIDDIFDPDKSVYWKKSPELVVSAWDTFLRSFIHEDRRIIVTSNFSPEAIFTNWGESLSALINRDFVSLQFLDSIKNIRQGRIDPENLFLKREEKESE